jgi:uncharacterized protein (DUF2147 family)
MLIALLALAASTAPGDIAGLWRTPVNDGVVRIAPCGAQICGRVVASAQLRAAPGQKDARNHDPALRGRAIKGLLVLQLKPLGPRRWGEGFVYNPDDGGTYKATAQLPGDGSLRLTGCIAAPLCRTQVWTRVK